MHFRLCKILVAQILLVVILASSASAITLLSPIPVRVVQGPKRFSRELKVWHQDEFRRALKRSQHDAWMSALWYGGVAQAARRNVVGVANAKVSAHRVAWQQPRAATPTAGLSGVAQCIKNHESGNYAESSHPSSGSGAYQFVPGTWRHWSQLAGFAGFAYAYEAPPAVQDAVLMFTLTHGGAHNWDPAYGNDPCTVGMG